MAQNHEQIKKFNSEEALNQKGFAEFLAKHSDAESFDMGDEEGLEKRFKTFEIVQAVDKDIQNLYKNEIEKEFGIKLDNNDRKAINESLYDKALNNPEELKGIQDKIKLFKELPLQIKETEERLAALGNIDELDEKIVLKTQESNTIALAKENSGFFGNIKITARTLKWMVKSIPSYIPGLMNDVEKTKFKYEGSEISDIWAAKNVVKEKYKNQDLGDVLEELDNNIEATEVILDAIKNTDELKKIAKESFENLKKGLFEDIKGQHVLMKSVKEKVWTKLKGMMDLGTIEGLDDSQKYFESLNQKDSELDTDIFTGDSEHVQDKINEKIEIVASKIIKGAVLNQKGGENMFSNLEKSLAPILEKEKLGTKEGDELRDFVTDTLTEALNSLGTSTEDKAKKLIVSRLIIKINKQ